MSKIPEIKVGYVLDLSAGLHTTAGLVMVCNGKNKVCISGETMWCPLERFDSDLTYDGIKVMKIYGFASNSTAHMVSIKDRDLLWERVEIRKMTVAEIEKELGYTVEIVK